MTWDQGIGQRTSRPFQNVKEHDQSLKIEQDMPCGSWEIFGNFEKSTLLQMPQNC